MLPSPEHLKTHPDLIPETVEQALTDARALETLHSFVDLLDRRARAKAVQLSERLRSGEELPLAGWLLAVKDNIAIKGERLTCASRILENFESGFTATAVQRLEQAGAIVIGKTNLDEFAMGSSSENTIFGAVRNPADLSRVAGGSSGGSAVAVAADVVHAALGSETGGSVRQPGAFCGTAALKPTYGRVSRYGLVAFGSSLDQIGAFAKSCHRLYKILCIMGGADVRDSSSSDKPLPIFRDALSPPDHPLRIGVPKEYFIDGIDPEILNAVQKVLGELRDQGHIVRDVSLPHTKYAIPIYYIIATAEASSNLARFDGVRYGWRHPAADDLADVYNLTRSDGFGPEVKRRIMMGTFVLSAGYFDAYYRKAQQVRRLVLQDFVSVFRDVDVLITPTTPTTAFRLGEKKDDPLAMYLSDIFTVSANLAGIPAVSIPIGRDSQHLPIGLQIIGPHFSEELILRLGVQVEGAVGSGAVS